MEPIDRDEVSKLLDDQVNERARLMRRAERAEERAKENEADCWCVSVSLGIFLIWLLLVYRLN